MQGEASIRDCAKCLRPVRSADAGVLRNSRSKQALHKRCVSAFKRRARANSKSRALRLAWEAMDDAEKVNWFITNTSEKLDEGAERDEVEHKVERLDSAVNNSFLGVQA